MVNYVYYFLLLAVLYVPYKVMASSKDSTQFT